MNSTRQRVQSDNVRAAVLRGILNILLYAPPPSLLCPDGVVVCLWGKHTDNPYIAQMVWDARNLQKLLLGVTNGQCHSIWWGTKVATQQEQSKFNQLPGKSAVQVPHKLMGSVQHMFSAKWDTIYSHQEFRLEKPVYPRYNRRKWRFILGKQGCVL